jgi:hypothetical protein
MDQLALIEDSSLTHHNSRFKILIRDLRRARRPKTGPAAPSWHYGVISTP